MKIKIMNFILILIAFTALSFRDLKASARNNTIRQQNDSVSNPANVEKSVILSPYHWNVFKLNPTPMLIWGETRNITLSYERLIKKNQSLAIQLGYLVFSKFLNDTIAHLVSLNDYSRQGVNAAFDYRYYPSLRNRRPAPDGLYIGGYLSYYGFRFKNQLTVLNESADQVGSFNGKLNMLNLGFEIGYQFLFWKRFSVDLLMFGPSLSYYTRQLDITGNLDVDQIDEIDQEFAKKLLDRFPALGYLFSGETTSFSGSNVHLGAGLRYSIQFGFHF
jgi:hypothetical protein